MTGMTKEMAKAIGADLGKLFATEQGIAFEQKFGVKVSLGGCTYDPTGIATFKLVVAMKGEGGDIITKEAADLDALCKQMGLPETVRGKKVTLGTRTFTIVGYKTRSRKTPFLAKDDANGKTFMLPEADVKNQIGFLWQWERDPKYFDNVQIEAPPAFEQHEAHGERLASKYSEGE